MKKVIFLIINVIAIFTLVGCLSKEDKLAIDEKIESFFPNNQVDVDCATITLPTSFDANDLDVYLEYEFESNNIQKGTPIRIKDTYYYNYDVDVLEQPQVINCKLKITYDTINKEDIKYKEIDLIFNVCDNKSFKYNLYKLDESFEVLDNGDIKYDFKKEDEKNEIVRNSWYTVKLLYSISSKVVTYNYESYSEMYSTTEGRYVTSRSSCNIKIDYNTNKIIYNDKLEINLNGSQNIDLEDKQIKRINSMLKLISNIDSAAKISGKTNYLSIFDAEGYLIENLIK
jgi:hypothetical protein